MKKIYLVIGFLALGLGGLGVALPILPSTPFLLAAAFCFAKSSEKLDKWFRGTKLYKNNLESFAKGRGMTVKTKLRIILTVTVIMGIAFIAMQGTTVGRIVLFAVWVCHLIGITFFVKTCEAGVPVKTEEASIHDD